MNKTIKSLLFLGLLAATSLGFAQTALTITTLSAAVTTAGATTITVASATGISAPAPFGGNVAGSANGGSLLFIEDGNGGGSVSESMMVTGVNGTTISVARGAFSTTANPHLSGAVVFVGRPDQFYTVEPSGACTAGNTLVTPYINVKTGNQWLCSTITGSWVPGFFNSFAPAGVTAVVASVAGATNPSGPLFHVSGTNAITAWGSTTAVGPGSGAGGGSATQTYGAPFCVIPDAAFTWTATNNIATAGTAVANLVICFTFDGTNKKYVQLQSK